MLDIDKLESLYSRPCYLHDQNDVSASCVCPRDDMKLVILRLIREVREARKRGPLEVIKELEYVDYLVWSSNHKTFPQIGAGAMEGVRAYLFYRTRVPQTEGAKR